MPEPTVAYRICPLCEACCGLTVELREGRVAAIRGDREDVFSAGYLCPKGVALKELHEDPDRLRAPLVKRDGRFAAASWEEAFAEIERRLPPILARSGRDAAALAIGNPSAHKMSLLLYVTRLARALGTRNVFSASTLDQMPKQLSSGLMFGHWLSIPVPDIERCDFLLMLGANPMASNGSLWTVPDFRGKARALQARGGRLVVVDPRRTETARLADRHLFIRPGSDVFFLLGLAHTLFDEGLVRLGILEEHVNGVEAVREAVAPFAPERVAARCGIAAETIRELARTLAATERAAVYGRLGTCTQRFGSLSSWLVDVLNALTGHLDVPGGAMFPKAAAFAANTMGPPGMGKGVATGQCGRLCPGYDHLPRRWRHLDTCQYPTILVAMVPRVDCPDHGVKQIRVPWGEPGSRFTALFEALIIDWLKEASVAAVARQLGLTWHEVDGVMSRAVRRGLARRTSKLPRQIEVDETSFQRRHEYVTVIIDREAKVMSHVADGRGREVLDAYYESHPLAEREAVLSVTMDMWGPYIASTYEHIPSAETKIAFDKFHVAQHLGNAVDKVRRQEHRALRAEGDEQLNKTKYLWLSNPEELTEEAWQRFEPLRRSSLRTARAWAIKEYAMSLWSYRRPAWAQRAWLRWYSWAIRSRLEPIQKVARMVKGAPGRDRHCRGQGHHQRTLRKRQCEDPVAEVHGAGLLQSRALPQRHLLPSRRPRPLPSRRLSNPHKSVKRLCEFAFQGFTIQYLE